MAIFFLEINSRLLSNLLIPYPCWTPKHQPPINRIFHDLHFPGPGARPGNTNFGGSKTYLLQLRLAPISKFWGFASLTVEMYEVWDPTRRSCWNSFIANTFNTSYILWILNDTTTTKHPVNDLDQVWEISMFPSTKYHCQTKYHLRCW